MLFIALPVIRPALFQAIMTVESNGNINAVGDGGESIGPFQIQEDYWDDAVVRDPSLTANGQTYQNCTEQGSIEYSKRVIKVKMQKKIVQVFGSFGCLFSSFVNPTHLAKIT